MNFLRETWDKRLLSLDLANELQRSQIFKNYKEAHMYAEQMNQIILENGLKGNEILMLEITNWMKKVQMASQTWKYLSDVEKLNKDAEMSSMITSLFEVLSMGPFDAADNRKKRRDWRIGAYDWFQQQNKSWFNPPY